MCYNLYFTDFFVLYKIISDSRDSGYLFVIHDRDIFRRRYYLELAIFSSSLTHNFIESLKVYVSVLI